MTEKSETEKRPVELLTRAEVGALLGTFSRSHTAIRSRAIILTFYRTGLRCAELCALKLRDLDEEAKTIRVRRGKGGKARTIPVDDECLTVLAHWLTIRASKNPTTQALFCTLDRGVHLETTYIRKFFRRARIRAGIEKRVYPHTLRHLYAVTLDRQRVPLHVIAYLLGHARSSTTSTYVDHMESQEAVDAIANLPPWLEDLVAS